MEKKTIWTILHLDTPTNDIEKIKKAYSEQTKTYNPEDNPEEFQELYNAYKQAMSYARNLKSNNKIEEIHNNQQIQSIKIKNNNYIKNKKEKLEEKVETKEIKKEKSNDLGKKYEISDGIEEINSFKELDFNDNENIRIQKMIFEIDQSIKRGNSQLKKVISSEEFYNLMHIEEFQLVLSKYLNNRINLGTTKTYIIKKSLKKYIKKYGKQNLTNSLKNYFYIIRNRRTPYYYPTLILCGVVFFMMLALAGSNNRKNNYNNTYNLCGTEIHSNINEILTYDKNNKISFGIPDGFEVDIALSDSNKRIAKGIANINITTITSIDSEKYYEDLKQKIKKLYVDDEKHKDVKITDKQSMTVGDRKFNYIDFSYEFGSLKKSVRYIWTDILENTVLEFKINEPGKISEKELEQILTVNIE